MTEAEWRASSRHLIDSLKDQPCADCQGSFIPYVMDFDHVRGVKEGQIGHGRLRMPAAILREAAKCDVVCSNCHRMRTFLRKQWRGKRK